MIFKGARLILCSLSLLVLIGYLSPSLCSAQKPRVSKKNLAVDSLVYQSQTFLGLVLKDGSNGEKVEIAVDRKWLADSFPKLVSRFEDEELAFLKPVLAEYETRIDQWVEERKAGKNDEGLVELLEQNKDQIAFQNSIEKLRQRQFIVLRFAKSDVTKMNLQPYKRKRIAALAWSNGLEDVTTKLISDLVEELKTKKVDIENETFDLSSDMAAVKLSDRDWAIRKAMFEMWNLKEMEFHGEGEMLFHKTGDMDPSKLLAKMMGSGGSSISDIQRLGRELGLPEFTNQPGQKVETDWKTKLTKKADAAGHRSILAKRIINSNSDQVVVEAVFIAKTSDTKWETVGRVESSARLADQTADDLKVLGQDARISKVLDTLKGIGLADDALIQTALRKGAATRSALDSVTTKMDVVLDRNSINLDRPLNLQGLGR